MEHYKKNRRKFPISIWEFEKPRGGGLNFSKMSEFQIGNKVNPGGGMEISKMSELKSTSCTLEIYYYVFKE